MADTSSDSSEDDKPVVVCTRDQNSFDNHGHDGRQDSENTVIGDDIQPYTSVFSLNPFEPLCNLGPIKPHALEQGRIEPISKQVEINWSDEIKEDIDKRQEINPKAGNGDLECYSASQSKSQDEGKAACDSCMLQGNSVRPATHLCFDCDYYLCSYCSMTHINHNMLKSFDQGNKRQVYERLIENLDKEKSLLESLREVKIHHKHNIPLRVKKDEKCYITGMAVIGGDKAILTDFNNSNVKIVDLMSCKIIRKIRFSKKPWGVTQVNVCRDGNMFNSVIAMTFPRAKEIVILDLNVKHSAYLKAHKLFDGCYEIEFFKQQYITLCYINNPEDPGARYYLYFLDVSGITGKVIKLYSDPEVPLSGQYVSFTFKRDQETIFVCCMDKPDGVIFCFDFHGQVFNKRQCSRPAGICVSQDTDIVITSIEEPENPFNNASSNITGLTQDLNVKYSHDLGKAVYFLHCSKDQLYTCNLHTLDEASLDVLYILQVE